MGSYWTELNIGRKMAGPLIVAIIGVGFQPALSYVIGLFLNNIGNPEGFTLYLPLIVAISLGASVFNSLSTMFITRVASYVLLKLRLNIFETIMDKEANYFEELSTGKLISCLLSEPNTAFNLMKANLPELLKGTTSLIFYIIFVSITDWRLGLILFGYIALLFIALVLINLKSKKRGARRNALVRNTTSVANESFGGWKTVKIFNQQKLMQQKLHAQLLKLKQLDILDIKFTVIQVLVSDFLNGVVTIAFAWYGLILFQSGEIQSGSFLTAWSSSVTCYYIIKGLIYRISEIGPAMGVLASLYQTVQKRGAPADCGRKKEVLNWGIEIRNLNFKYLGHDSLTLREVSIKVPEKTFVAIVGQSGSGKSTLLAHCLGLLKNEGCVYVGGVPLQELEREWFYSNIGYVSQDVFLIDGTIEDNIRFGKWDATIEEIEEACMIAHAQEFVSGLPEGYKTHIGERGVKLSGGQKQRIALARVIIRKPKIMFLDEATSALDSKSEKFIQDALESLRKSISMVVVAHRLSTIKGADHIYVLENGAVVEEGAYSDLLSRNGRFKAMVDNQKLMEETKHARERGRSFTIV